jgi:putative flippase GtrA
MTLFLLKFLKFCIVGTLGLLIDFCLTFLFKEKLKINKYISNSGGFICAATANYILNRIWTFYSTDPGIFIQYTKFIIISVIGLFINNTILFLFHRNNKMNFYFAKLIAILFVTLWNFLANYFYTFSNGME